VGAVAVALLLGLVIGVGTFTFGYGKGFSYLQDNPQACANCHVMQENYDSWVKSSHHATATCNDCHLSHNPIGHWVVKGDNGFFHSLAFTTGWYHDPIQIKPRNRIVTQNACVHCHQGVVHEMLPEREGWIGAEKEGSRGSEMMWCASCHADVGHAGRRRGSVGIVTRDGISISESEQARRMEAEGGKLEDRK
jgi:cytochrome c nitrite reductase small subunit